MHNEYQIEYVCVAQLATFLRFAAKRTYVMQLISANLLHWQKLDSPRLGSGSIVIGLVVVAVAAAVAIVILL